jgi:thioredoxin-related protein
MTGRLISVAAVLLLIPSAFAQEETTEETMEETMEETTGHEAWFADFDQAQAKAKEAKKDLLVDFTGSDWCGWCIRLDKEVFSQDAFKAGVKEHFILVALDFPRDEALQAKVPNPERNQELNKKYGVQGYPSVLLMFSDGTVYGRTGYRPGGAEPYVQHLNELRTVGRPKVLETLEFAKKVDAATAEEKMALLNQATTRLATMGDEDASAPVLLGILEKALGDGAFKGKDNETEVVNALLKAGRDSEPLRAAAVRLDPKNEQGLRELVVSMIFGSVDSEEAARAALVTFDEVAALGIKDKEVGTMLYVNAAQWCSSALDEKERAKGYARKLQALAPDNPHAQEFCKSILEGD